MTNTDKVSRQAFICGHTQLLAAPHVPEIILHLADDSTELWRKTEDELGEIGLPPPFWAFAWAGGQALARYILDHREIVRGRRVLDFATGSGLVGIAAAMAGAASVYASDVDAFAIAAIELNAGVNHVSVQPVEADLTGKHSIEQGGDWDVVLAGDISYEPEMARVCTEWLYGLHQREAVVLIGDPGRAYLAKDRLEPVANYRVPVIRDLEDAEVKNTSVWRFGGP